MLSVAGAVARMISGESTPTGCNSTAQGKRSAALGFGSQEHEEPGRSKLGVFLLRLLPVGSGFLRWRELEFAPTDNAG